MIEIKCPASWTCTVHAASTSHTEAQESWSVTYELGYPVSIKCMLNLGDSVQNKYA